MIAARLFNKAFNLPSVGLLSMKIDRTLTNGNCQYFGKLNKLNHNNVWGNNCRLANCFGVKRLCFQFGSSKISQKQVNESSYDELVAKLAKLYNFQQYKIPSTLSLLQIHHQYNIFKPGDWVLDIGAGPNWSWTELALKLTHSPNSTERVISCDLLQYSGKSKLNNIIVTGNFEEEQVKTKIAMNLINNQLNTILVDATPEYSGNQQLDADETMQIFVEALKFAQKFLKKGGTIIFKTIESSGTLQCQNQAKFFFNEVYRYRSPSFRIDSPAFFYVLKGYMITDNLTGLKNFLQQYFKAKSNYTKIEIVEKYREKYQWDPIKMVNNEAKNRAISMISQGRKNKQIAALYENDPYVKISEILKLIDKMNDKKLGLLEREQARREFLNQKSQGMTLPKDKDQFAQALFTQAEKIQKQLQEQQRQIKKKKSKGKQKIKNKERIQDRAPLSENQTYLKTSKIKGQQTKQIKEYLPQDLYGFHPADCYRSINKKVPKTHQQEKQESKVELEKIMKTFPEIQEAFEANKRMSFDEQFQKFQQKIDKQFSVQTDEAGEIRIKRNPKGNNKVDFNQEQQQDQQISKTMGKTQSKIKNRVRNLRKVGQQSQFNFETEDPEVIQKKQQEQFKRRQSLQLQKQSKLQYLKSKPKKNSRNNQNQPKGEFQKSYFKVKNKNKGNDNF